MKFDIQVFFEHLSRKLKCHYNLTNTTNDLQEDQFTLSHLAQFFLEWETFRTKVVTKIKTHISFSMTSFHTVYRIMLNILQLDRPRIIWRMRIACCIPKIMLNILQLDRPHITIWRMRIACCIPKSTNTHSEYLILIAFAVCVYTNAGQSSVRLTLPACLGAAVGKADISCSGRNLCRCRFWIKFLELSTSILIYCYGRGILIRACFIKKKVVLLKRWFYCNHFRKPLAALSATLWCSSSERSTSE